jgi:hypothetical protein
LPSATTKITSSVNRVKLGYLFYIPVVMIFVILAVMIFSRSIFLGMAHILLSLGLLAMAMVAMLLAVRIPPARLAYFQIEGKKYYLANIPESFSVELPVKDSPESEQLQFSNHREPAYGFVISRASSDSSIPKFTVQFYNCGASGPHMRKTLEIDNGEECTIASQMFNNFMMADSRRNLMQDLVIKITDEAQGYE